MRQLIFSRKTFVLSSILIITILCGMIFLGLVSSRNNTKALKYHAGGEDSHVEIPRWSKQIELEKSLRSFEGIVAARVFLSLDNEITSANIFLTTNEVINDSELDNIALFVSQRVEGLEKENVWIEDRNDDTYLNM